MRVSPLRLLWPTQVRAASPLSFSSVASRLTVRRRVLHYLADGESA